MLKNTTSFEMPLRHHRLIGTLLAVLLVTVVWSNGGRYLQGQVLAQVLSGGLLILMALQLWAQGQIQRVRQYPLLLTSLLWLVSWGLSFLFSVNRLGSLEEIFRLLMYQSLALLVYLWATWQQNIQAVVKRGMMFAMVLGVSVVLWAWWMDPRAEALSGSFHRTSDFAGFLLLFFPLALHLLLAANRLAPRLVYGGCISVLASALWLAQSRTSWLAAGLSAAGLLIWHRKRINSRWMLGLVVVVVLAGSTFLFFNPGLALRFQSVWSLSILQENATQWRIELLRAAWEMFRDHPLLGLGPNAYGSAITAYQQQAGYQAINPHNYYLQQLAETGLLGTAAFLAWLGTWGWSLKRFHNRFTPGLVAGAMASLIHIAFDLDWSVSAIPIVFFLWVGLSLASDLRDVPPSQPSASGSGVLLLIGMSLMLVPSLNYLSAQYFQQALHAESLESAGESLTRARLLAPWPSARQQAFLAQFYQANGFENQALESLEYAINLDRYQPRYYKQASDIHVSKGRLDQAEHLLLQGIQYNPYRHPSLYTEVGDFFRTERQNLKQAEHWYRLGVQRFPVQALSRYERYTPGDRYELFNLYQRLSELKRQQKQLKEAEQWGKQAQALLKAQSNDMYVKQGYGFPIAALNAYWQHVRVGQDPHQLDSVHAESNLLPLAAEFDGQRLHFFHVERNLFSATVSYAIPEANKMSALMFEDRLVGNEQGWKLIQRRQLEP